MVYESKDDLYSFLISQQFKLIESKHSPQSFGNFFDIWQSAFLNIRFVQDRSDQSIQISSLDDSNNWVELELIKSLLGNELDIKSFFPIAEAVSFFKIHFLEINTLFARENYKSTRLRLEELGNARRKKMFPNL
jgi:hypothetical protein